VLDQQIVMLASVPLMLEYEAVLTRPEHLKESGLSVEDINAILDTLAALIEPVTQHFLWRPRLQDPADEMVLETAVNGNANYLVTFNVRHFGEATTAFGIRAVTPGEIVRKLKGMKHEEK
jgi:putative PIN family toxin of toxin-antitoxin system